MGSYVQFGCGTCAPEGWRNFDAGPAFWLQKYLPFSKPMLVRRGYPEYPVRNIQYADVINGLPVRANSANAVYCSHVLEHLALFEFRRTIRNVYSYLVPGGIFRLVVPDFEFLIKKYLEDPDPNAASKLLQAAHLGEEREVRGSRSLAVCYLEGASTFGCGISRAFQRNSPRPDSQGFGELTSMIRRTLAFRKSRIAADGKTAWAWSVKNPSRNQTKRPHTGPIRPARYAGRLDHRVRDEIRRPRESPDR